MCAEFSSWLQKKQINTKFTTMCVCVCVRARSVGGFNNIVITITLITIEQHSNSSLEFQVKDKFWLGT